MTVETRKLNLIEEFIKITDEDLITRMEELVLVGYFTRGSEKRD